MRGMVIGVLLAGMLAGCDEHKPRSHPDAAAEYAELNRARSEGMTRMLPPGCVYIFVFNPWGPNVNLLKCDGQYLIVR